MWSWIAKILGLSSSEELSGISLPKDSYWEVAAAYDHAAFIRQLPDLLPEGSTLYLEGTGIVNEVNDFLRNHQACEQTKIERGTLWPRPKIFHLPMNIENVGHLASFFETHEAPEICDHFHAYKNHGVLLEWHDAFTNDPILISLSISEKTIKTFSDRMCCPFKMVTGGSSK